MGSRTFQHACFSGVRAPHYGRWSFRQISAGTEVSRTFQRRHSVCQLIGRLALAVLGLLIMDTAASGSSQQTLRRQRGRYGTQYDTF